MSTQRELHCYDYVNAPYARVREAFLNNSATIFQRATASAADRAGELAATLSVDIGPLQVGVDVKIELRSSREEVSALGDRVTYLEIAWVAARGQGLFPSLEGTLSVTPLGARETQIDLHGRYLPPLGIVGQAIDAFAGRRVAEASLRRFVDDMGARLRAELVAHGPR